MADKRTKRVSFARISVHQMSAENYDWGRLEAAYGHEFSIDARQRIVDATQSYFMLAGFELSAEPLSAAIQSVRSLQKSAKQFHKSILREHNNPNRWGRDVAHQFNDPQIGSKEFFQGFSGILASLDDACERTIKNLVWSPRSNRLRHRMSTRFGWCATNMGAATEFVAPAIFSEVLAMTTAIADSLPTSAARLRVMPLRPQTFDEGAHQLPLLGPWHRGPYALRRQALAAILAKRH